MKIKNLVSLLLCLIMAVSVFAITGCKKEDETLKPITPTLKDVSSDTLYVKKVEGLKEDFVMGMDASTVLALEQSGVKYYDFDGTEKDVFEILSNNGINTIRVRVWNNPFDKNGNGYGGGNCTIDTALKIGKRANQYGMNLMVDFHYSDFWADPAKQMVPLAWKDLEIEQKAQALYDYTIESMTKLKDAGIRVNMVQIGNETNGYFCGEKIWFKMQQLFAAGCKAVKEVYPNALRVLHFANPEKITNYKDYAKKLDYYAIDYDVFASSYYPYWHGTLENLSSLLGEIATTYNKKVMVAETSYAFTAEDTDFSSNTIGDGGTFVKNYPFSIQGQANSVRDVIETVNNIPNGIGVCYWEGTWITVGTNSWEENSAKWEKYGSGWASSYAAAYDPGDAGKYYGGCAVDNQAFFDKNGKVLESLKVFALSYKGNVVENKPDALEDVNIICDLNGTLVLPETVNAVMLDDSKQPVSVTWDITQEEINQMYAGGVKKYEILGVAGGMTAHCYVSMVEKNFLTNYSFEDDKNATPVPTGWTVIADNPCDELYVEAKKTDSLTGVNHFHFYGKANNSVDFSLEQKVENLPAGKYKYSISIMGGDGGTTEIYAYVKINGVITMTAPLQITVYEEWHTSLITNIEYNGTDELVVGIYVKCSGSGNGAWGKIDDALLNSLAE